MRSIQNYLPYGGARPPQYEDNPPSPPYPYGKESLKHGDAIKSLS